MASGIQPGSLDGVASDIVISGASLIACLGVDRHAVWQSVKARQCGIAPLTAIESPLPTGADGGQAAELADCEDSSNCREVQYLRRVIVDALSDAGLERDAATEGFRFPYPLERCATVLGTTLHGMRQGGSFLRNGDVTQLRTFLAAAIIRAAHRGLGLEGPALSNCSACSSSLGAIALGVTLLQTGAADLVVAGGYDPISEYAYAGFNSLRLISPGKLRPFARDRAGMKVGEGYAVVVLERAVDQQCRGGRVLARLLGYGESADAHHLTQPHPSGRGAATAMTSALDAAKLKPQDIHLIAAHATGTPDNDAAEYAALSSVFGDRLPDVPVVAFKSHLSHTLGAAGALELILSMMALSDQTVPPCANVSEADTDFSGLRLATGSNPGTAIKATMNLSLGFGGANTCIILGHPTAPSPPPAISMSCPVYITGVGVLSPGAVGNGAFQQRLAGNKPALPADTSAMPNEFFAQILSARRIRRMSGYVKLSLTAAMLAIQDAGIGDVSAFCQPCSAVLGTTHGAADYCAQYYKQIVREGIAAANPLLFAEGVPNAAAAHLSMAMGMTGSCQTIIGSRTAGLDALGLAAMRIASGCWDRAIVVAADEHSEIVNSAYESCGGNKSGKFSAGWGAAALVLESERSIQQRGGGVVRGSFIKYAAGAGDAEQLPCIADSVLRQLADPPAIMLSRNGTWLDQVEMDGVYSSANRSGRRMEVSSLSDYLAECFSAGPLTAVAAVLLDGRLPRSRSVISQSRIERFATLATDNSGLVAGALLECQYNG